MIQEATDIDSIYVSFGDSIVEDKQKDEFGLVKSTSGFSAFRVD